MDFLRSLIFFTSILIITVTFVNGQATNSNNEVEEKPERWWHFFGRADGSDWKVVFAYIAFSFGALLLLIGFFALIWVACCRNPNKKYDYRSTSLKSKGKQAKYLDNKIGGKSAARHEKDNDSLQVDVDTFYQPNNKHHSKISEDSKKHNSVNHTDRKAEEGGSTALPVIAAAAAGAGAGALATAALVNERDSDDEDDRRHDEGIGPSLAETEHNSSGHSYEHNDTLRDASSLPDSAHGEDNQSGFGAAMVHHAGSRQSSRRSSRRSRRSGSPDSIDRNRETRDDDLSRKTTPLPLRSEGTDFSHVDTDRGSLHTERDNLAFEPDSTSKRSSNLSHHGFARGGSPDSRAYGDDYRRDSVEDNSRVSVADVHRSNSYNGDRISEIEMQQSEDVHQEAGQSSGLRRWPSQESLERGSSTKVSSYRQSKASDVGSINPTWRDEEDDQGVGFAAVGGYRQGDTRDSESEHDLTRDEDDDDRSGREDDRSTHEDERSDHEDDRDSLADYERPDGVGMVAAAAAEGDDHDDDEEGDNSDEGDEEIAKRTSVAASSEVYQTPQPPSPPPFQPPSPPPVQPPQSPLGSPAPAGVSSGLAGLGTLIAAKAKKRENDDLSHLERKIDREEDPSEAWLRQNANPANRVSSANIQSKLGMFEELKQKSSTSWGNRRTAIRDSGGPVEYGNNALSLTGNRDSGEIATISTASPFNVDDSGEVKSGTLVRRHIAQLESKPEEDSDDGPAILRREGAFRKRSDLGGGTSNEGYGNDAKPLETVSISPEETVRDEVHSTHSRSSSKASNTWIPQENEAKRSSAIGQYENAVIESNTNVSDNRASASLDSNVNDWPDERDYARSERSDIGSGSNFTSSRVGMSSQVYDEGDEDEESIRYEVEPREGQWGL